MGLYNFMRSLLRSQGNGGRGMDRRMRSALGIAMSVAALLLAVGGGSAQAAAPQIEATWVTNVTATSATLRAEVNPNGLSATYRFEYTTQAAWEASGFSGAAITPPSGAGALGSGNESISVARQIS